MFIVHSHELSIQCSSLTFPSYSPIDPSEIENISISKYAEVAILKSYWIFHCVVQKCQRHGWGGGMEIFSDYRQWEGDSAVAQSWKGVKVKPAWKEIHLLLTEDNFFIPQSINTLRTC